MENVPQVLPRSRDQAASAVGVSGKLVSAAKAIREADPERFEKVKQGKLSVAKAKKETLVENVPQGFRSRDQAAEEKTKVQIGLLKQKADTLENSAKQTGERRGSFLEGFSAARRSRRESLHSNKNPRLANEKEAP